MIISKTPYRLSFFGGGTDYNSWFEENPGIIISSTFSKYCYISLRKLPPFFDHKTRVSYSKEELVKTNSEIKHPAVRNALKFLNMETGLEIHHDGDLPARSGIGSSSSFTVGMLNALYALEGRMVSKQKLADDAIYIEQVLSAEHVGIQDQIIASFGGLQIIEMGPNRDYSVSPLILPKEYKDHLESHILLGFTGLSRIASENAKEQIVKIQNGDNASKIREIYDISLEGLQRFKSHSSLEEIGRLLNESWKVKRTLTQSVSNQIVEDIYTNAIRQGAYGGKLLGAGGGGFVMFIAPPHRHEAIKKSLPQMKVWIPFHFEENGSQIIFSDES